MHDMGYNFFNLNKLTYSEINVLINAFNHREARKEKEQKKLANKAKSRR